MTPMAMNPRSVTDIERPLIKGLTVSQQAEVIQAVRELGYPDTTALGLAGWLAAKAGELPDRTTATTRAKYRRILKEAAGKVDAMRVYLKLAGEAA